MTPSYAIKKADVDSFLAESSRPQFSYRLLIATTDRLGPTARRTLDAQREPVGYLLRSQLELAPVAWPDSPDDLRPRRPPRKKPFPHVREAIRDDGQGLQDDRPRPVAHGLRHRQDAGGDVDRRAAGRQADPDPGALALAPGADPARVERQRHQAVRLPRGLLRRDGRRGGRVRPAHRRAGAAGHHRPRGDRRLPAPPGSAGRLRHLPVLAADRRRLHGPDPAASTSRSPTRPTAARGGSAPSSRPSSTPSRSRAGGGCS